MPRWKETPNARRITQSMDSEIMDRVRHLAKDGISAEVKVFGKAIVALTDEIAKLKDELKEARQEIKEAKSGAGAVAPARQTFKRPGAAQEDGDSEGSENEGEEAEEAKPSGPPAPPSLGSFGG